MKRPAAKVAKEPKAKRARPDPHQSYCERVREGLDDSKAAPAVIKMLQAMSDSALLTSKDKRHQYQAAVVQMVTDLLQGVGEEYERSVADKKSQIASCDVQRTERSGAVQEARDDLESKKKTTQEKKYLLAADAQAFKAAKESLSKAQAAVRAAERDLVEKRKAQENLESILTDLVTPLVQGTVAGEDARRSAENLLVSLKKLSLLDESLLTALPEAITKEPAARGAFDTSVVSGLQEELDRRRASTAEELAATMPKKEECERQMAQAEAAFEEAKAKQHLGAEAYNEARSAQSATESKVKQAVQALSDLDPAVKALQKDLGKIEKDLAAFYAGPRAALAELSERIEIEETAAEDPPAGEAPGPAAVEVDP